MRPLEMLGPDLEPGVDENPGAMPDSLTQRVHVGIWYILWAQRGSHIPTLRAEFIPYSYMDPLG